MSFRSLGLLSWLHVLPSSVRRAACLVSRTVTVIARSASITRLRSPVSLRNCIIIGLRCLVTVSLLRSIAVRLLRRRGTAVIVCLRRVVTVRRLHCRRTVGLSGVAVGLLCTTVVGLGGIVVYL